MKPYIMYGRAVAMLREEHEGEFLPLVRSRRARIPGLRDAIASLARDVRRYRRYNVMSVSIFLDDGAETELCVSNRNFMLIMNTIGWPEVDYCGIFAGTQLDELIAHIKGALGVLRQYPALDGGIESSSYRGKQSAVVIDCGLPPGYFVRRLTKFLELAERAKRAGSALHFG